MRLRLLLVLLLTGSAARVWAEEPSPSDDEPGASALVDSVPSPLDGQNDRLRDDAAYTQRSDPVLLVTEGLHGIADLTALRARLSELFGRPVVGLASPHATAALATLWVASEAQFVVLRLSHPEQADLWHRLPRETLGADPARSIANAVLDMLWSDRLAQSTASEVLDPFCPPGLVCREAGRRRSTARRSPGDAAVLDPWDGSYQRFGGLDPLQPRRYHGRGDPWGGREEKVSKEATPRAQAPAVPPGKEEPPAWTVGLLGGGGVHGDGGFIRYEASLLRRFARFDVGLTFVGGRGQPDPARLARRALAAAVQRRFVMDGLELDLGGSVGTFVSKEQGESASVRPYLRALGGFAIPLSEVLHLVVQSELGTTFANVGEAGAFEYALSLGFRQRL